MRASSKIVHSRSGEKKKPLKPLQADEWIYGINPVLEALRAGRKIGVLYLSNSRHEKVVHIRREAGERNIPVEPHDLSFFDIRFPKGHQGVAARVFRKDYVSLDDLMMIPSRRNEVPLFLVIDLIEDPRNLGAILRSAEASGVHGVVIQAYRSAGLGPEVSKSSAGAVEYVPVSMVPNIKHAIQRMREEGVTVVGMEAGGERVLWEEDLTIPLCVVIGSEGKGMRKTVGQGCDRIARLPMRGKLNSLNVSVTAGVVLFEIQRQRFIKKMA
jgi:23S rRNA (guanosine2251-2'-O)-methyltransferase